MTHDTFFFQGTGGVYLVFRLLMGVHKKKEREKVFLTVTQR